MKRKLRPELKMTVLLNIQNIHNLSRNSRECCQLSVVYINGETEITKNSNF